MSLYDRGKTDGTRDLASVNASCNPPWRARVCLSLRLYTHEDVKKLGAHRGGDGTCGVHVSPRSVTVRTLNCSYGDDMRCRHHALWARALDDGTHDDHDNMSRLWCTQMADGIRIFGIPRVRT